MFIATFQFATDNLEVQKQNIEEARSIIADVDRHGKICSELPGSEPQFMAWLPHNTTAVVTDYDCAKVQAKLSSVQWEATATTSNEPDLDVPTS